MCEASTARVALETALSNWATGAGFRLAARGHFVAAAEVVAAARDVTQSTDSDSFLTAAVLRVLTQLVGGNIERCKPPHAKSSGGVMHWGVTSQTMQAAPFDTARPTALSNKKAARQQKRDARGKAPPDPERLRELPRERGVVPHFTRYTDELLSMRAAPALLELRLFPVCVVVVEAGFKTSVSAHCLPLFAHRTRRSSVRALRASMRRERS